MFSILIFVHMLTIELYEVSYRLTILTTQPFYTCQPCYTSQLPIRRRATDHVSWLYAEVVFYPWIQVPWDLERWTRYACSVCGV